VQRTQFADCAHTLKATLDRCACLRSLGNDQDHQYAGHRSKTDIDAWRNSSGRRQGASRFGHTGIRHSSVRWTSHHRFNGQSKIEASLIGIAWGTANSPEGISIIRVEKTSMCGRRSFIRIGPMCSPLISGQSCRAFPPHPVRPERVGADQGCGPRR
jgi:hypothetical protein